MWTPRNIHRTIVRAKTHLYLPQSRNLLTLAIETSCDDTSVAILEKHSPAPQNGPLAKLHFHERITSDSRVARGIHPISAVNAQATNLGPLVQRALPFLPAHDPSTSSLPPVLLSDGAPRQCPDFITATRGPGMRANLTVGLSVAKGLAAAWSIPLLAVHHMQAHLLTPGLVRALCSPSSAQDPGPRADALSYPFLSLLASGGHTFLSSSTSAIAHTTLAETVDIALGEALDKIGRSLLPSSVIARVEDVAFGKHLSAYAFPNGEADWVDYKPPATRGEECTKLMSRFGWGMVRPLAGTREERFSFSGVASGAEGILKAREAEGEMGEEERRALARMALTIAFEHVAGKVVVILEHLRQTLQEEIVRRKGKGPRKVRGSGRVAEVEGEVKTLVLSGGVAANAFLRTVLRRFLDVRGFNHVELVVPPAELCTDNAAMIGWCGMEMWELGWRSTLDVLAIRKWSMDEHERWGVGKGRVKAEQTLTEDRRGILAVEGWYNVNQTIEP